MPHSDENQVIILFPAHIIFYICFFKEPPSLDSYYDSDNFEGTPEKKVDSKADSDDEERRRHDSEVDGEFKSLSGRTLYKIIRKNNSN